MPDGAQAHEPLRRPRGRHAVPTPPVAARGAWPARPFRRRRPVLVGSVVSIAAVALIGGAVALTSIAAAPSPDGEAATVVGTQRPSPTDPGAPSGFAPILPSAEPPPSASPSSPAPPPVDEPAPPVTGAPVESPVEPGAGATPPSPPAAPGPTNQPASPSDPAAPEECDEQGGFLGLPLFGPPCR